MKNIVNAFQKIAYSTLSVVVFCFLSSVMFAQSGTWSAGGGNLPPTGTSGPASFPITVSGIPAGAVIQDINITLEGIEHTFASDLEIDLVAPTAGAVQVCYDRGGSGGLDPTATFNGPTPPCACDIIFDDAGAFGVTGWTTGAQTYMQPFVPENSLDAFGLTETNPNGVWSININDDAGGDTGSLAGVSIFIAYAVPACEITCPSDIVVPTAPGICESEVIILPPPIFDDGSGIPCNTVVEDFNSYAPLASSGDVEALYDVPLGSFGSLLNTPITFPALGPLPAIDPLTGMSCNTQVLGTVNWSNFDLSFFTEQLKFTVGGVTVGSGPAMGAGDCNNSGSFDIVIPAALYNSATANGTLPLVVTLCADPDVDPYCSLDPSIVSIDLSAATACVAYTTTGETATGMYPLGTTEICYSGTASGSGLPLNCCFDIVVQDLEPPVLNCPRDLTMNLQSGECCFTYDYEVTFSDNCGFQGPDMDIDGTFGDLANCPGAGSTLSCGAGQTSQVQEIDISALPAQFVLTDGCFVFDNTAWGQTMATINFYCADAGLTAAGSALPCATTGEPIVATSGLVDVVALGAAPGAAVCVPVFVPDAGGMPTMTQFVVDQALCGALYMEVLTVGGAIAWNGPACNGITSDGTNTYLCSPGCGDGYFADFGFTNIDAFFAIQGAIFNELEPTDPSVPVSGTELGLGVTTFSYEIADASGNVSSCEWTVTVNGLDQNEIATSLACNDHVNVSLDENCQVFISADMFLEGGPYGCYYDCYEVEITDEFGNIVVGGCGNAAAKYPNGDPAFPNTNPNDVNGCLLDLACGTYTYMVHDACNDNTCWGTFLVEDKIAPIVIPPADITLNCLQSTTPSDAVVNGVTSGSLSAPVSWTDATTGGVASVEIPIAPATTGAVITGITLDVELSHSWIGDINMNLTGPDGTTIALLTRDCSFDNNMNATFDDVNGGALPCNDCGQFTGTADACEGGGEHEACGSCFNNCVAIDGIIMSDAAAAGGAGLASWNGTPVGGAFTLDVVDAIGGDGGCLEGATITVTWNCPVPQTATIERACGNEDLSYTDEYVDNGCGGSLVTRTWIATDEKGNSGSATQTLTITQIGAAGEGTQWFWPRGVVDLTCGACYTPECIYDYFRGRWESANPWPDSWVNDPEWYEDDIAVWGCNANAAGVRMAYPGFFNKKGLLESFIDNNCNMFFDYSDQLFPACAGNCGSSNNKIIRTWTALDWCTAETRTAIQVIEAKDTEAPTFDLPAGLTVGASPWGCAASFDLPVPEHLEDDCSTEVTYRIYGAPGTITDNSASPYYDSNSGTWRVQGLPKVGSPHEFIYEASDCCGNLTTGSLFVTVVDQAAPIATAIQNVVVNLTSAPTDPNGGVAKIYATSIDNGSHDGDCGPVRIAIRRLDGDDDGDLDGYCGNFGKDNNLTDDRPPHNNNNTYFYNEAFPTSQQPTDHDADDTDNGEFVKFCCQDLMEYGVDADGDGIPDYALIDVELGVWDDANMDGTPGTPGDLFSTTWATVRVEAKLAPSLACPPDVTLTCEMDETDLSVTGVASGGSTCGGLSTSYMDLCGLDVNGDMVIADYVVPGPTSEDPGTFVHENSFNKACHYGPITRYWTIDGTDIKCRQIITLSSPSTVFAGCGVDLNDDGDCNDPGDICPVIDWPYSRNRFIDLERNDGTEQDCDGDGRDNDVRSSDITLVPGSGFPDYAEVQLSCIEGLCDEPVWVDANCSLVGWSLESDTFNFEGDACRKIINTYTVIDWCQYDPNSVDGAGIWTWTVIGKLIDPYAPVVDAPDAVFPAQPGGSGSNFPTTGACTGTASMCATASDTGVDADGNQIFDACPSEWLKWNVYVDINNDWTFDREWSSFVARDKGTTADPFWSEDNAADNLAVYGYLIPDVRVGNGFDNAEDFATAPFNDDGTPFKYQINIPDAIPADCGETQHRVVWKVYDGCGNVASTTSYFTVQDQKAPTPFCINLSTALMADPDGDGPLQPMVELWAIDFDAGSFDNCTDYENLRYTFGPTNPDLDPDYIHDMRSSAMVFTCDDLNGSDNAVLTRNVYVWDACGNYDFCTVNLRVIGDCTGNGTGTGSIAGTVMTEFGETVENVEVENYDMMYQLAADDMTTNAGKYAFGANTIGNDFVVSADKNDDYLNGVSTLDLVIIQKHILGVQQLNSAYKMIAADVNNDGSITAIDLIELRKLILGIYDELPNNSSWRFADASKTIDIANPWSFDETIDIPALTADQMQEDFVGIKVGDVNQSVEANFTSTSTESRSSASIAVNYDDRAIEAGETVELEVQASDLNNIYGYQFTLGSTGLELMDVQSGLINVTSANFGALGNVVTTSWNSVTPVNADGTLFTMVFKSNVSGTLSEILDLNSKVTRAEAYVGDNLDIVNIDLRSGKDATGTYVLYQNEPNPFTDNTVVGFELPNAGSATLTVLDVTGKVLRTITGDYPQGYNQIKLSKSDFGATGVLYYQLESGDFTASKKMIIIE